MGLKKGDTVARTSYGKDIYFKVTAIDEKAGVAQLKGIDIRLCADAPLSDLEHPGIGEIANYKVRSLKLRVEIVSRAHREHQLLRTARTEKTKEAAPDYVNIPGSVLHLDGDQEYLETCRKAYNDLEMVSHCFQVSEEDQPERVVSLLREFNPDLLVLTGHDGMMKAGIRRDGVENYYNSRHFIAAVLRARAYQPSKDDLVIFAGACQSWYEGLLSAGANFASSPERILIHCLDPVLIVQKVAFTPVSRTVSVIDVLQQSVTGIKGVGGIESRGQFRLGLPKIKK